MIIWLITGLWIALGCAQLAHVITLFTNRNLETYIVFSCVFVFVGILSYVLYLRFSKKRELCFNASSSEGDLKESIPYVMAFVVLALISLVRIWKGYAPELSEGTYDIVLGNLQSGNIMEVHPFIGNVTQNSMPIRRQFIGLTSLYSALIQLSSLPTYVVLCKVVPTLLWIGCMLVYWMFAQKLFVHKTKRWLFLCVVALFYLLSAGGVGMPGRQLFYAGFTGEAIRSNLLIPYTLYATWQKKWFFAVIAILVEACIVWTTYGIGYCFVLVVCMLLVHLFLKRRAHHAVGME